MRSLKSLNIEPMRSLESREEAVALTEAAEETVRKAQGLAAAMAAEKETACKAEAEHLVTAAAAVADERASLTGSMTFQGLISPASEQAASVAFMQQPCTAFSADDNTAVDGRLPNQSV